MLQELQKKIRNEKLQVKNISVFIRSNKFSKNQKQYNSFKTLSFINPTNHIFRYSLKNH